MHKIGYTVYNPLPDVFDFFYLLLKHFVSIFKLIWVYIIITVFLSVNAIILSQTIIAQYSKGILVYKYTLTTDAII